MCGGSKEEAQRLREDRKQVEVEYSVLGEVIDEDRLYIDWGHEEIVNVPPRTVAHDGPVYDRPVEYPKYQDALNADSSSKLKRAENETEAAAQLHGADLLTKPCRQVLGHKPIRQVRHG